MAYHTMDDFSHRGLMSFRALEAVLIENWWLVALRGALAIAFGLLVILFPGPALFSLVLLFAAFTFVDGIFAIGAAIRAMSRHERWGLMLVQGVVSLIAAAVAFFMPHITVLAFVMILAAWSIVSGVLMLVAAVSGETKGGSRWWIAAYGLLSLVFGVLLAMSPVAGAIVLTWWIGAYALATGVIMLVMAFTLRSRRSPTTRAAVVAEH